MNKNTKIKHDCKFCAEMSKYHITQSRRHEKSGKECPEQKEVCMRKSKWHKQMSKYYAERCWCGRNDKKIEVKHNCKECARASKYWAEWSKEYYELRKRGGYNQQWLKKNEEGCLRVSKKYAEKCRCKKNEQKR